MAQPDEPRFDWPAIGSALLVIVLVPTIYAFAVPPLAGMALNMPSTGPIAGNDIYRWGFWGLAWGMIIWRGAWMARVVHERIVDDMLVTSAAAAAILLGVKFLIWVFYAPVNANNELISFITPIDTLAAVVALGIAWLGARANRY